MERPIVAEYRVPKASVPAGAAVIGNWIDESVFFGVRPDTRLLTEAPACDEFDTVTQRRPVAPSRPASTKATSPNWRNAVVWGTRPTLASRPMRLLFASSDPAEPTCTPLMSIAIVNA